MNNDTQSNGASAPMSASQRSKRAHLLGMLFLGFIGSFLGAWLFLATGLVRPDVTSTLQQNRETLVLQEGEIIAEVFKKVNPSTVAVTTQDLTQDRYFGIQQVSEGAGSGIVLSNDGYILTNKHVVPEGVDNVTVVMHDGTEHTNVKVVGRDPSNDIAFLKVEGVNNLTPANLGDSSLAEPGQKVVAIGNALGVFRNSVTSGIISGIGRPIQAANEAGSVEQLENLLQTDTPINPGNSGGPLVNLKGEIIGVNTAVSEKGQAIGFAIPINDAKGLIRSVLTKGKMEKAYLGVRYVTLTSQLAKELQLGVQYGAYVSGSRTSPAVVTGSPADKAGLREKDVIIKVNDQDLKQRSLASVLAQFGPGDKISFTLWRDGKEQKIDVTLEAFPE